MFTCGEFGCNTKAMKHSAITLSHSGLMFTVWFGAQNHHGMNGLVGVIEWIICVTGGGERG